MFRSEDTIVAIATPEGRGAIGVVRLSGSEARRIAETLLRRSKPLQPRRASLGRVLASNGAGDRAIDQVVATFFPEPRSYTGEDVVEIAAHGNPLLLRRIVECAMESGARLAEPGEFTLRAFLSGKIDLVQAESISDLVAADTPLQARVALDQLHGTLTQAIQGLEARLFDMVARLEASLDFPEEGYHFVATETLAAELGDVVHEIDRLLAGAREGRVIREGRQLVIAGKPNVGKSSLFNQLAGFERAIVTPSPGTTRDLLSERVDLAGLAVTVVDTAGVREGAEAIEQEGIARARAAAGQAELVVLVLDRSRPLEQADEDVLVATRHQPRVTAINKCDLPAAWALDGRFANAVEISAVTGEGMRELRAAIARALVGREPVRDSITVTNLRQQDLLVRSREALARARSVAEEGAPEEVVLIDVREALDALGELTGRRTSDDVLHEIFKRFCIGK
jgi:tRNA modification GTPase